MNVVDRTGILFKEIGSFFWNYAFILFKLKTANHILITDA
jgi:hypothetical protein